MSDSGPSPDPDHSPSYLDRALDVHEKLLTRAMVIADKRPATALQSVGIYIVLGATLLKALSTVAIIGWKIDFTTFDFAIMMACGTLFIFGSSYLSLAEYKDQVRWYDEQLKTSSANSQKALEVIVSHATPAAPGQRPVMAGNLPLPTALTPPRVG
jgi:hypothetical protein